MAKGLAPVDADISVINISDAFMKLPVNNLNARRTNCWVHTVNMAACICVSLLQETDWDTEKCRNTNIEDMLELAAQ